MEYTALPRNRAVFLDRDGTLNHDTGYTHRVEDLWLLDHVVEGLQLMMEMGFQLIVTTNQSGIARGYYTEHEMRTFHASLVELLQSLSIVLAGIYYCPFHPTQGIGPFRRHSPARKPAPGMLLQAAREHNLDLSRSYAIGDKKSDVMAGQAAGCRTILVLTGAAGSGEPELVATPDYMAHDLLEAALIIQSAELHTAEQQVRRE